VEKGSSFILTFPLLISMIKQESKKDVVARKNLRILIAEDNLSNREMMKLLLEHKNWNFDVVYNGRQVVEKFQEADYDLILMDVQMPEMDGFETTRAVRKIEEDGKYTPILAVTAFYMEGYEKLCKLSGMDGYLEKPVNTDKFYHLIEELIRLKR
jgi:CheY-like chemotaxis protein